VENITVNAKSEFHGDAVRSLIDLVNSETEGDNIPFDRKSGLSKKEIERAIKWCTKGNGTSWMYRKIK